MIPVGTLCIAKNGRSPTWNDNVANTVVEVISHNPDPDFPVWNHEITSYKIKLVGGRCRCPAYLLIPISNPGLADEITKETSLPKVDKKKVLALARQLMDLK